MWGMCTETCEHVCVSDYTSILIYTHTAYVCFGRGWGGACVRVRACEYVRACMLVCECKGVVFQCVSFTLLCMTK